MKATKEIRATITTRKRIAFLFRMNSFPAFIGPKLDSTTSQIGPMYRGTDPIVVMTMNTETMVPKIFPSGKETKMFCAMLSSSQLVFPPLPFSSMKSSKNTIPINA